MQLATRSPSWSAISDPATPGSVAVLWTMSFGVQLRLFGSPKSSANSSPDFLGALASEGRSESPTGDGAGEEIAGLDSVLRAGALTFPPAVKTSGMSASAAVCWPAEDEDRCRR